jgi:CheY-like chemotaxis protein
MKLLIIEDDEDFLAEMKDALREIGDLEIIVAMSRDAAIDKLRTDDFDLITCDLKIPTRDGALDANVDHGRAVYREALEVTFGTPIIVFSAFGNEYTLPVLMEVAHDGDFFGNNSPRAMVSFMAKEKLPEYVERIREFADEIRALDAIEISPPGFQLSGFQKRALRIYARRVDGTLLRVSDLAGGLSDTRILKVQISGAGGVHRALIAAKLGSRDLINDEKQRYQKYVSPALRAGSHATFVGEVMEGAGNVAALFYKLDEPFARSIFDVLRLNPENGSELVQSAKEGTQAWRTGAPQRRITVQEIRRSLISDDRFKDCLHYLKGIDIEAFERSELEVRQCAQHCDFHGSNILVDGNHRTLLIDYGEVDEATSSLDAITLELSVLFHPNGASVRGTWPRITQLESWDNLDIYTENCPFSEFIRACRTWAFEVAAGGREVFANLYAYCVRQLAYADTNKDFALTLVRVAIRAFEST